MPADGPVPDGVTPVSSAADVRPGALLGISTSYKPGPGRTGNSAVRSLLRHALAVVARAAPDVTMLDLREHRFPLFDGRLPDEYDLPSVRLVSDAVVRAGSLMLSVPAYWGDVSGVFKNMVDVLCGPAYDLEEGAATIFEGKPVGLLVVGADEVSAHRGAEAATVILGLAGAEIAVPPVVVANPRDAAFDARAAVADLVAAAAHLAMAARA